MSVLFQGDWYILKKGDMDEKAIVGPAIGIMSEFDTYTHTLAGPF